MPESFPDDWRSQPCLLVSIPVPLAPYVSGLLAILEKRGFWDTDTAYLNGYSAATELEACIMSTCLNVLLEKQDALYRLVNTGIFGVTYATVSEDPLVVTPAIAPHVTLDNHDQDSIMGRLDRVTQLMDNTVNGTATDLYSYSPSVKDLLQSLIDAITSDTTDLDGILAQLETIAVLVA
jgi:hypothetical protein